MEDQNSEPEIEKVGTEEKNSPIKEESKIEKVIKNKENLILIGVLVFTLIIRLYYFILTKNQPLWWDEAEYLNLAKNWAFGFPPWALPAARPVLFPVFLAFLYKIGANELVMRSVPFLASIASVYLIYLIGKEMYSKKIGLISSFMLATFWSYLFYSARILVDVPVSTLWLLGIFLFWKGYVKNKNKKYLWLLGPILIICFLTKFTGALLIIIILVFLLVTERVKFIKNKNLWISGVFGIILVVPFLIFEKIKFGNAFQFYIAAVVERDVAGRTFIQTLSDYITTTLPMVHSIYLILFIIGLITLVTLFIGLDLLIKNKENKLKPDFFLLSWFLISFLYIVKLGYGSFIEERLLFFFYPAMFIIAAKGLLMIYNFIAKQNKNIAIFLVIGLLVLGGYQNLKHGDDIIKIKKDSFIQLKDAGELIKSLTSKEDSILVTQMHAELTYSSERRVIAVPVTKEEIDEIIIKEKPKYYVLSIFIPQNIIQERIEYPIEKNFKVIQAYGPYIDQEQKIPILTIFEINYENA